MTELKDNPTSMIMDRELEYRLRAPGGEKNATQDELRQIMVGVREEASQKQHHPEHPAVPPMTGKGKRRLNNQITLLFITGRTTIGGQAISADNARQLARTDNAVLLRGLGRHEYKGNTTTTLHPIFQGHL